jgi:hypothetical protein
MDVSVEKQTEINEWSYNSKRDTLFFSQLFFIGISILIVMYWMSSMGLLSDMFVIYVMIIIFALLLLIWYVRYKYTRNNRDKTHWNKIVFPEDGKKPSTLSPTVINSVAAATAAACAKPSGSVTAKPTETDKRPIPKSSWESDDNLKNDDSTWNNIDYSMFKGQKYGFNTKPTGPGSAGVRDNSGKLYGDKNKDGKLGIWDTSGEFLDFDDVSTRNLNTQQGLDFNSINAGKVSPVSRLGSALDFCEKNPTAYDPETALPCKQTWCMANPEKSWKDPATSKLTPCKTLFSYL